MRKLVFSICTILCLTLLIIFFLTFLVLIGACNRFSHQENARSIPSLEIKGIAWPSGVFSYYKADLHRFDFYLLYYHDNSFFEENLGSLGSIKENLRINPSDSFDLLEPFHGSSIVPGFNYNVRYTYYRLTNTTPRVEGLFNEDEGVFIVRFAVPKGRPL